MTDIKKVLQDTLKEQFLLMLSQIKKFHDLPLDIVIGLDYCIPEMQKSPAKNMMEKFLKFVLPHKKIIEQRKNSFFDENRDMFYNIAKEEDVGGAPMDKRYINGLTDLWYSDITTPQRKENIWKFFDIFIVIMEEYKKKL